MCVCVPHVGLMALEVRKRCWNPLKMELKVVVSCPNLGPLPKQPVLLTPGPSPQPFGRHFHSLPFLTVIATLLGSCDCPCDSQKGSDSSKVTASRRPGQECHPRLASQFHNLQEMGTRPGDTSLLSLQLLGGWDRRITGPRLGTWAA